MSAFCRKVSVPELDRPSREAAHETAEFVQRPELVRTRWPKIHVVIEDVHEVIAQERRERAARAAGR